MIMEMLFALLMLMMTEMLKAYSSFQGCLSNRTSLHHLPVQKKEKTCSFFSLPGPSELLLSHLAG